MYITIQRFALLLSVVTTTIASPALDERSKVVSKPCIGNTVLSILNQPTLSSLATSFCKSYLSITPVTITTTSTQTQTPNAVTITSTTGTVTVTTTIPNPIVQTVYTSTTIIDAATTSLPAIIVTATLSTSSTQFATIGTFKKRALQERTNKRPAWLNGCEEKALRSACSCLSLSTPAVTTTVQATYTASTPTVVVNTIITNTLTISTVTTSAVSMTFDTLTIPAQTILTTVVSVSVSTSTVLAPQCSNLVASPVNYQPAGILVIAGVGGSATVSAQSPEDCCSHCATNQYCFAFSYGTYDPAFFNVNDFDEPPPVTSTSQCYNYVFINTALGCYHDAVAFGPINGNAPAGGSSYYGYSGGCSVSTF